MYFNGRCSETHGLMPEFLLQSKETWTWFRLQNSRVFFFSKPVKKSLKCGVRVLRARSARASPARRAGEAREKTVFLESPPLSLSVFSLVPDLLFDCSRVLEYAKTRTVLQSRLLIIHELNVGKRSNS